ncbi:sensor domain-containing diguanylate cyclase [Salinimonas chungwhensis]|uniref:sensor domain-containing diguanylate cyclase n=1 Tax=Salinimonas chungwhensis TaxID=265425 RepID=UPI0003697AB5|nr:GGDEF domain-containing protein [Salinimonas chungwhensis]
MNIKQIQSVLGALPDPVFILSGSGKYVALFGGQDVRYYHDGTSLVGQNLFDVLVTEKAEFFVAKINEAIQSNDMLVVEYELRDKDILAIPDAGPEKSVWYEGRVQRLDFTVEDEEVVLWVATNISERYKLEKKLRYWGDTDQLTELFNRRRLEQDLAKHHASFSRYDVTTSVLMLDLDNFKSVNDTEGHHKGDEILVALSTIVRGEMREADAAYRYGGDEFVIVLPNTRKSEATVFAERLSAQFAEQAKTFSLSNIDVSISIGVTVITCTDDSHEMTLRRADKLLYDAKRSGKNTVKSG